MRVRLGERDPSYQHLTEGTPEEEIAEREKIFADFTLLRSKQFTDLPEQAWMDLQDRRWHQYCEAGFSFTPPDPLWAAYFKSRMKKDTLIFQTLLPAYTSLAVETTKQKLRELAEKATKADKVGSLVGVLYSFHSSRMIGHARMLGSPGSSGRPRARTGGVDRRSGSPRGSVYRS